MAKLWGGRFSKNTNELVDAFNASIEFDKRLYHEDIRGSIAHATMLAKCGIIPEEDAEKMNEVVVTGYGVAKKKEVEMSNIKMQEVSVITSRQNVVLDTLVSKDDVLHFNQYMEKALRYPKTDLDSNKMGAVILSFELNRKKVPSRIRIEDGFSKESNKEVIRLLAEGPKWENTPSGKRIQARIHFTIGKNGESHKAILEVLPSGRKP